MEIIKTKHYRWKLKNTKDKKRIKHSWNPLNNRKDLKGTGDVSTDPSWLTVPQIWSCNDKGLVTVYSPSCRSRPPAGGTYGSDNNW